MRKKKNSKLRSALAIFLAGAMVLGMIPGGMGQVYASDSTPTPAAAFDETSVSDPSTVDTWNQVVKDSTENIGRIWTDKTVLTEDIQLEGGSRPSVKKGDSDFLVGLSALSSTSNTVKTVSRPLDVVLVLDRSGSMDDPLSTEITYTEEYHPQSNGWFTPDYFIQLDGKYVQIEWHNFGGLFSRDYGWGYQKGREWISIIPKTSSADDNTDHVQVYVKKEIKTSRMEALKAAVISFIEKTAEQNALVSEKELKHRISIVSYASNGTTDAGLTVVEGNGVNTLKNAVNRLQSNGGTYPQNGMKAAENIFKNARDNAQKALVFFTDGMPGNGSTFSSSEANGTIGYAKNMKTNGTLIYSIGVLEGADPSDTTKNINAYLHGVSSNYLNATAWNNLGERTDNSDYYKAATDADELNNIFNEISSDLETGLGFPTQIPTQGYDPGKVGYITFTDQLGEYMQVDEFKSLVFADQIFDLVGEPVTENGVTTYKYEGSATGDTELYPNGNVKDIIVQVKKGADLKTGDTVTVRIPAGLIPLRHFTLDTDSDGNKTLDIQEAYPIRIFYGVSIKPEVRERIADGLNPNDADDEALQQYLNAHNENGVPYFYSNYYNGQHIDPNGKTLGNTIASFQPAKKNTFYYFTEDTPIYTDKDCTMAVKNEPSADQT